MSAQMIGNNRPQKFEGRPGADKTRQASTEELLAEFKHLLESAGYPPFDPRSSVPIASASHPAAARKPKDVGAAHENANDLSADGPRKLSAMGRGDARGRHRDLIRKATRLRSRRWKLAASGLALGLAAVAGVDLALMPSAPAPKSPLSEVLAQRQSNVQPPVGESAITSSDINGPPVKDGPPHLDHAPVGRSDVGIDPKDSTANTSAPVDAQRPAEGSNAIAVATSSHAPALATAAASVLTASQTPPPVPVQSGLVRPDGTPIEAKSSDSAVSTSPSEATKPNEKAATAAGVRAEPARQPAAKIDSATRPPRDKKMSARKNIAKTEKARTEPTARTPYPPPRPAPSEKAMVSPTAQTVADSAVAAPTAPTPPTSFAAQSVGQLTNAFVYLTHLPGALIEHTTGPSTEAQ